MCGTSNMYQQVSDRATRTHTHIHVHKHTYMYTHTHAHTTLDLSPRMVHRFTQILHPLTHPYKNLLQAARQRAPWYLCRPQDQDGGGEGEEEGEERGPEGLVGHLPQGADPGDVDDRRSHPSGLTEYLRNDNSSETWYTSHLGPLFLSHYKHVAKSLGPIKNSLKKQKPCTNV